MIELNQAQEWVLSQCEPLPVESVEAAHAVGLITAEDVISNELVPPFDNTAVDGFAVRSGDTIDPPNILQIVGAIAAGQAPTTPVADGQAIRIMTGAPVPPGSDAIVMIEDTVVSDDNTTVTINVSVSKRNALRAAGEDMQPGQTVFRSGTLLRPGHLGVLATLGISSIRCHRRPVVGVLSTGDELVDGPQPLQPGQIRDSNRRTLLALVSQAGCETIDLGLIRDNEQAIEAALRDGAARCDALVTSGGVSMGDFDYVKAVLSRIAEMRWMQVAIKPAKPLAVGRLDGTPIFGLPGNPVSSMVSFELFARPGLRAMMGFAPHHQFRPETAVTAASPLTRRPDGKTHFARVVVTRRDGRIYVDSAGGQGSHQLAAMAGADALAILPDGNGVDTGDELAALLLHDV